MSVEEDAATIEQAHAAYSSLFEQSSQVKPADTIL